MMNLPEIPATPLMKDEERYALLQRVAQQLGEHFDAVQLLVTWNEDARSEMMVYGCGNWYARQGMAREFIAQDQAQTQANQIADQHKPARPKADDDDFSPL